MVSVQRIFKGRVVSPSLKNKTKGRERGLMYTKPPEQKESKGRKTMSVIEHSRRTKAKLPAGNVHIAAENRE
jgi:hypothetical protein